MNTELKEILTGFKRAWGLINKNEKLSLILATVIMAAAGLLTNLPAVIIGRFVDQISDNTRFNFNEAVPFIGIIVLIIVVREGLTIVRKLLIENVATQTDKKQTVFVIEHLLKADIAYLNQTQIGALHGRILRSLQGLIRIIKLSFLEFLPTFFTALAAIIIAFYQKPLMASVMILVIPIGIFIIIKQISSQKGIRISLIRSKEKIDGTVVEMLGGIETIRVLDTTYQEVSRIEAIAEKLRLKEIKHHLYMSLFDSLKQFNEGFLYILVVSISIFMASSGAISKGDILVYSILFLSIVSPLREIHRILDQAHESSILVNDLHTLLSEPLDPSFQKNRTEELPDNSDTIINIHNLDFSYPAKDKAVLRKIKLTIKKGEKIGIAGASGSGKSTLIKILLRLTHNYSGEIKLFGENLQDLSRQEIARRIAYVPQKTYIFSGTIKENIVYGVSQINIDQSKIVDAAKKANIYEEITKSLGGFEGRVTEGGNNLSGGQRQRLALARLILKNPDLFIFDEATSALDNTNERIIQENIEKLFKDRTMITIAHRLTTLKNSDRILVFAGGRIVQEGDFHSLSNQKGLFKEFLEQTPQT
jgi:ATP-binding cassette, subfamily B, bacterial